MFNVFLMSEHPQNRDEITLREGGVRSGDTLTIKVPEPLPSHVKVKLESDMVDFGNSKLQGQDTLIFIVDLDTETLNSLKRKVQARLDTSVSFELTHGSVSLDDTNEPLRWVPGVGSGDSFYCYCW